MRKSFSSTQTMLTEAHSPKLPQEQWQIGLSLCSQTSLSTTAIHLRSLGLNPALDGYRYLEVAIPYFSKNPELRLHKDVYPEIAKICGANDALCVEHSIRNAIKGAWLKRDLTLWKHYFSLNKNGDIDCPSNKLFIATLAEML